MKADKGLSLVEILVALIITGIIAACVSAAVLGGYYMLKQAEHKSRAMSITHVQLQKYMAMSFDDLTAEVEAGHFPLKGNESDISEAFENTTDNTFFNWTVDVKPDSIGPLQVPYLNVTVDTVYTEVNTKGEDVSSKTVRLSNVVPYPLIHIQSEREDFYDSKAHKANFTKDYPYKDTWTDTEYNWNDAIDPVPFSYKVPQNLIVMYNLAINYDTSKTPDVGDTVITRCLVDDKPWGIVTRTPVLTQIYINNILRVENVTSGKIQIEWCKENNDDASKNTPVWLRAYDVTIVAVEYTDES